MTQHSREWLNGYHVGYRVRPTAGDGVRFREGVFERQCQSCRRHGGGTSYWPLTPEFWYPRNLTACKACLLTAKRLDAKRKYWADPEAHRARARAYHRAQRKVVSLKKRARYAELDEARKEAKRAQTRHYYAIHRDERLAYAKAYRARKAAA